MKFSEIDIRQVGPADAPPSSGLLLNGAVFADSKRAYYLPFLNSGSELPPVLTVAGIPRGIVIRSRK